MVQCKHEREVLNMSREIRETHQILLTKDDGAYIVLYNGSFTSCVLMFQWYMEHNTFFNGEFSIREI